MIPCLCFSIFPASIVWTHSVSIDRRSRHIDHAFRPCISIAYTSTSFMGGRCPYRVVQPGPSSRRFDSGSEALGHRSQGFELCHGIKEVPSKTAGSCLASDDKDSDNNKVARRTADMDRSAQPIFGSTLAVPVQRSAKGPSKGGGGVGFDAANVPNSHPSWSQRCASLQRGETKPFERSQFVLVVTVECTKTTPIIPTKVHGIRPGQLSLSSLSPATNT